MDYIPHILTTWTSKKIAPFVLLCILAMLSAPILAQNDSGQRRSSQMGMDFSCNFNQCFYNFKGNFIGDIATLKNDAGALFSGFDINASANSSSIGNPVAYVSGKTMKLKIDFTGYCTFLTPTVIGVRGKSSTGFQFPAKVLTKSTVNGQVKFTYESEASSNLNSFVQKKFPTEKVDMLDLEVTWQVNVENPQNPNWNDDVNWNDMANTINRVYVTWREPKPEPAVTPSSYLHEETLFYIGCKFATNLTTNTEIINAVWNSSFFNANVRNVHDENLHYYLSNNPPAITTSELLNLKDGGCPSWARFFLDVFKAQGVDYQGEIVDVFPVDGAIMMVKSWNFNASPSGLLNNNADALAFISAGYNYLIIPTFYKEAYPTIGIAGQNQPDPFSQFYFHNLAKINNYIYDPSYGQSQPFVAPQFPLQPPSDFHLHFDMYEDASIAGYWKDALIHEVSEAAFNKDFNNDGDKDDYVDIMVQFVKKISPSVNNLEITSYSDY